MVKFLLTTLFVALTSMTSTEGFAQSSTGLSVKFVNVGNYTCFWAKDNSKHYKLFVTDISKDTVTQVTNFVATGDDSVFYSALQVIGNDVYFIAKQPGTGDYKVYVYTPSAGTPPLQVSDTTAGTGSDGPSMFTPKDSNLYFYALDPTNVQNLYRVDTSDYSVTQISRPCIDGGGMPCWASPGDITPTGTTGVYFTATEDSSNYSVYLHKFGVGTFALNGPNGALYNPQELTMAGTTLYFHADDPVTTNRNLYYNDGTDAVAHLIGPTSGSGYDDPYNLTLIGVNLFLSMRDASNNTKLYKIANAPASHNIVQKSNITTGDDTPESMTKFGLDYYFVANSDLAGNKKLYKLDHTTSAVTQITDTAGPGQNDGIGGLNVAGNYLCFNSLNSSGYSKGYCYSTANGLVKVLDSGVDVNNYMDYFIVDSNYIYFRDPVSKRQGRGFYAYNGTLTDLTYYSSSSYQAVSSFQVNQGNLSYSGGYNIYAEDLGGGTLGFWSSSTSDIYRGNYFDNSTFAGYGTGTYFAGQMNNLTWDGIQKILKFDFASYSTAQVSNISGSAAVDDQVNNVTPAGTSGGIYYTANDGTGIHLIYSDSLGTVTKLISNTAGDDSVANINAVGTAIYYTAQDSAAITTLYKADKNSTLVNFSSAMYANNLNPTFLYADSSKVYFKSTNAGGFIKLFEANTDGTGLVDIADRNGAADDNIDQLVKIGNYLYFTDSTNASSTLYSYDTIGHLVTPIAVPGGVADPKYLTVIGSDLYFSINDGFGSYYVTKMTSANVFSTISAASTHEFDPGMIVVNGSLFFRSTADSTSGPVASLIRYNPTTSALTTIAMPDSDTKFMGYKMVTENNYLYFVAKSGTSGLTSYFRYLVQ